MGRVELIGVRSGGLGMMGEVRILPGNEQVRHSVEVRRTTGIVRIGKGRIVPCCVVLGLILTLLGGSQIEGTGWSLRVTRGRQDPERTGNHPRERARASRHFSRRAVLVVAIAVCRSGVGVVLKVGMVAGRLGRDAAGGIVDKEHLEEVETGIVEVGA